MQDGASNKSVASYLFGLFFLTEEIGNNVGLSWMCRILIIWSSYGLFCDRSKASSIVSFSECESNFQYLLLSLRSSNSCLHLLLLHLPHPFICPSITWIITVLYFVFCLTMFIRFLKLYTSHSLPWECLTMCCVPLSVIITVFKEILFQYVIGYFFFQGIESGVQWPMCICFS
jgi:hypothetical protein